MRGSLSCLPDGLTPAPVEIREIDRFYADPQYSISAFDNVPFTAVVHVAAVAQNGNLGAWFSGIPYFADVLQRDSRRGRWLRRSCHGERRLLL
jgi:hypothetical protein